MSMIHMKKIINKSECRTWSNEFLYEILPHAFRINTFTQLYPVHYHVKDFSKIISEELANYD